MRVKWLLPIIVLLLFVSGCASEDKPVEVVNPTGELCIITPAPQTGGPTNMQTSEPTEVPTAEPTAVPTDEPTEVPTEEPTKEPTGKPTETPTEEPTKVPATPTRVPATATPAPATASPEEIKEQGQRVTENGVTYVLGIDVYSSKEALRKSFFGDFYEFIGRTYGENELKRKGVNSFDDFYYLLSNFNAGHGELTGLGDNFGLFFLSKDPFGFAENQPETHFIGYCRKNGMYTDFIDAMIRFFSYWREDEIYTANGNHGSDFFWDSWASCVDTCKFFYYTSKTSYVGTARVRDLFDFCPSVIYGDISAPKLRGYTFGGWYLTPEFTGEPVTDPEPGTTVYAKWTLDSDAHAKDTAALTDSYISNLTKPNTNSAPAEAISGVWRMYSSLTDKEKALVTKYNVLRDLL